MLIKKGEWSPKSLCPTYLRRLLISSIVWMLGSVVAAAGQANSSQSGLLPDSNPDVQLQVMVRDREGQGDPVEITGDWVVNPRQEWQLRVTTDSESFVYLVGVTNAHTTNLLWPASDNLSLGRMAPWVPRSIPGEESFLQASQLLQFRNLLILVSKNELSEISSILVRIEAQEGETSAVRMALHPHAIEVLGRSLTGAARHAENDPSTDRNHVLTDSGDRIRSLLDGAEPDHTDDDMVVVVVEQGAVDGSVNAEDDTRTPSFTNRIKSWVSFGAKAIDETDGTTLPADNSMLSEHDSESRSADERDPQLQGLADALALDVPSMSLVDDEESNSKDQVIEDSTDDTVVDIPLPVTGLDDLLPPINRGGVLPTLRFPGPRVSPPILDAPGEERVNIATAMDGINQFLLDAGSDEAGIRELVASVQLPGENTKPDSSRRDDSDGKMDQILGKLFWWRSSEPEPGESELPDSVAVAANEPMAVDREPEVIVVQFRTETAAQSRHREIATATPRDVATATPPIAAELADDSSTQNAGSGEAQIKVARPSQSDEVFVKDTAEGELKIVAVAIEKLPAKPPVSSGSPQSVARVIAQDDDVELSLWARFAGLFGGDGESSKDTTEPDMTASAEQAELGPVEPVIGQTADSSHVGVTPPATLEVHDYDSGLINGPPSKHQNPVRLSQDRETVLANATVLGAEGDLIRRLLGEVEDSASPAGSEPAAVTESPDQPPVQTAGTETPGLLVTPVDLPGPLLLPLPLDSSAVGVAIDVETGDDVSSSVVLVVSPGGTGTGTVIDRNGHVLTNWHVVKDSPSVLVIPKKPGEARPDEDQILLARVVRLNRFADLALLQVLDPPETFEPVAFAPTPQLERGQTIHAIGHPNGAAWRHTVARVARLKSKATWHSGNNLAHRGSLISADVRTEPGNSGAPLFNDHLQLVGISAAKGNRPGQVNALSLETILQFLGHSHGGPLVAGD